MSVDGDHGRPAPERRQRRRRQRLRRLLQARPRDGSSAKTGKVPLYAPEGRPRRRRRRGRLRLGVVRRRARESARPPRRAAPAGRAATRSRCPARPGRGRRLQGRRLGRARPATGSPTCCSSSTRRPGRRWRASSTRTGSCRSRRARPRSGSSPAAARCVQRVDPATGEVVRRSSVGHSRGADIEYRGGAIWIATPDDDTVYKIATKTGDIIPISVGQRPRQLALGDGRVYVTNYNSSELYAIDEKRSRVVGEPLGAAGEPVRARGRRRRRRLGREPARQPAERDRHRSRRVITPVRSA